MVLFLVSNNLVLDDIIYETDEFLLEKRINRPLSIEGEKNAVKIVKKINASVIYSSSYASSLSTAKYYASYKKMPINISSFLNDALIGEMENRNIKMLRYMQEKDFDFKFNRGESLKEVSSRMNIAINRIIKKNGNKDLVVFTHKRAILGYLLAYLDKGYNLDDRLILSFKGKMIIDDTNHDIDIIKLTFDKDTLVDASVLEMG